MKFFIIAFWALSPFFISLAKQDCPTPDPLTLDACTIIDNCTAKWKTKDLLTDCHDLISDAYKAAKTACMCPEEGTPALSQAFNLAIVNFIKNAPDNEKQSRTDCANCLKKKDFIKNLFGNFKAIQQDYKEILG